MFRFLDNFNIAHRLWLSLSFSSPGHNSSMLSSSRRVEISLDMLGRTFNGMYLLLETSLLLNAFDIDELRPWGGYAHQIGIEAQRFWFLALVCGVLVGIVRLWNIWVSESSPRSTDSSRTVKKGKEKKSPRDIAKANSSPGEESRLRRARTWIVFRRLVADILDLPVPGSVVGWVNVDSGTVGIVMLGSTLLTAWEVWDRCGRELAGSTR
jgi:hypothetical protein